MSLKTWVRILAQVVLNYVVSLIFLIMCFPICEMKMLELMHLTSKDLLKLNKRIYFKRVQYVLRADIFECLHFVF